MNTVTCVLCTLLLSAMLFLLQVLKMLSVAMSLHFSGALLMWLHLWRCGWGRRGREGAATVACKSPLKGCIETDQSISSLLAQWTKVFCDKEAEF